MTAVAAVAEAVAEEAEEAAAAAAEEEEEGRPSGLRGLPGPGAVGWQPRRRLAGLAGPALDHCDSGGDEGATV